MTCKAIHRNSDLFPTCPTFIQSNLLGVAQSQRPTAADSHEKAAKWVCNVSSCNVTNAIQEILPVAKPWVKRQSGPERLAIDVPQAQGKLEVRDSLLAFWVAML